GGHLIIGMAEDKGVPTELIGLDMDDLDAEKNRLDHIIQNGIQPRLIPGHQIHGVTLNQSSRIAIVIRVRKSLTMPHMVTFKNTSKFYSRNWHGKYQLDVGEIRNLFLMSETAIDTVRNFRTERLSKIIAEETPI